MQPIKLSQSEIEDIERSRNITIIEHMISENDPKGTTKVSPVRLATWLYDSLINRAKVTHAPLNVGRKIK